MASDWALADRSAELVGHFEVLLEVPVEAVAALAVPLEEHHRNLAGVQTLAASAHLAAVHAAAKARNDDAVLINR